MTRSGYQSNLDVTLCNSEMAGTRAELRPSMPPTAKWSPSGALARGFCRSFSCPSSFPAWRSASGGSSQPVRSEQPIPCMAAYRPIRHAAGTRPSWPWLAVTLFALAWAVLDLTGSARDLGFVIAAKTAPLVILLLVGGVFADRLPRRGVMLTAEITRMGI